MRFIPNYIIEHCSLELLPWNRNFHHPGKKEQWIPLVGFFKQVTQKSMLDTLIQAENSHKPHPHFNGFQKIQAATMKPLGLKQPLYADQVHQSRLTPTGVTNKMYLKKKLFINQRKPLFSSSLQQPSTSSDAATNLTFPDSTIPEISWWHQSALL